MGFDDWEKENSSKLCPHIMDNAGMEVTVTRCRLCVWEAAYKEANKK
jgi:hypothetical protein